MNGVWTGTIQIIIMKVLLVIRQGRPLVVIALYEAVAGIVTLPSVVQRIDSTVILQLSSLMSAFASFALHELYNDTDEQAHIQRR